MRNLVAKYFRIDPRSLALLRFALGAILLVDLAIRATDLRAHYTDAGAVPRSVVSENLGNAWRWSLHSLDGSATYQGCLFLIAAVVSISLLVGYRTRAATVFSWLLLFSLHTHNPFVINAGDGLLRLILMWSIFLPLGRCWSIDSRRRRRTEPGNDDHATTPVLSLACVAIMLQVCVMYWATAYFKVNDYWQSGDALHYVFSFDAYARPLAVRMLAYPELLTWLSRGSLVWEFVGPALLFFPWRTAAVRMAVIIGFVLLHIGIELTLTVGLFSYVSLAAWAVFIPPSVWNVLTRAKHRVATSDQTASVVAPSPCDKSPATRRIRLLGDATVAALLVLVLVWNAFSLDVVSRWYGLPTAVRRAAQVTGTYQKWSMFDRPPRRDGWFVAIARLTDGQVIDLGRGGKPVDWESWQKPPRVIDRSKNHRWRKFSRHLLRRQHRRLRPTYCDYLLAEWRRDHPTAAEVARVELFYMQEETVSPADEVALADELPDAGNPAAAVAGTDPEISDEQQPPVAQRLIYHKQYKPLPLPDYLRLPAGTPPLK